MEISRFAGKYAYVSRAHYRNFNNVSAISSVGLGTKITLMKIRFRIRVDDAFRSNQSVEIIFLTHRGFHEAVEYPQALRQVLQLRLSPFYL